jgi:glycosyltransferase involved in cell wall biosynthesis
MQNDNLHIYKEKKKQPDLSVVVLCYKSGKTAVPFLNELEKELNGGGVRDYELVLVGNYFPGTDNTPIVVRELALKNPRIIAITLEKQGMMGWDMISGLNAASGKTIALIDGDGQIPPRDIVRLYKILKDGELDLVTTFRKARMDGVYRRFISFWYNTIFHIFFPKIWLRDVNAKPKVMTRAAYKKMQLSCTDWFIDAEIILESMRLGLNIAEIPTIFYRNEIRSSFVNGLTILEFLTNLVVYRIKYWLK